MKGMVIHMEQEMNYQEAYEKEHLRNADLAGRVADLEARCDDLTFKLNRIKNNPLWKMSAPLRRCMHFVIRQKDRIKNCGNLKGIIAKIKYKKIERQAMGSYGRSSFPTPEEAKRQREEKFTRMPKISILVPLYNTPENVFLWRLLHHKPRCKPPRAIALFEPALKFPYAPFRYDKDISNDAVLFHLQYSIEP